MIFLYWDILQLRTWTWTLSHVVLGHLELDLKLVDLDLAWTWLFLDLIQVCSKVLKYKY